MPAPAGVIVRRALQEEFARICVAHLSSIHGVSGQNHTPEQIESWCVGKTPELYAPVIARYTWYVADAAGVIAGFGELDPTAGPGLAEIRGLYLGPRYIGRGVGRALMDRLLADARA